jgi:hypothetical protein
MKMKMADVEKEYASMGYVLTELDGAIYVQKQEAIRDSKEVPLPTLRDSGWNSSSGAQ